MTTAKKKSKHVHRYDRCDLCKKYECFHVEASSNYCCCRKRKPHANTNKPMGNKPGESMTNESGEKMGMKEEFEKVYNKEWNGQGSYSEALWAVKWAMERCTKIVCSHNGEFAPHKDCCQNVIEIRQLAKELNQ